MIAGIGLGLRFKYIKALQNNTHPISWLELLADHFHDLTAPRVKEVETLLQKFPCVLHAVNLSLASSDPLNEAYLKSLDAMVARFKPQLLSDHLCFSHVGHTFFHDLLPIPFTHKLVDHIAFKIEALQQRYKIPFLIENISSYLRLQGSEMTEATFIKSLAQKTGCGILLDVNNIVVTCHNHQESITEFCSEIPFASVKQIHLAGAIHQNNVMIDTHSRPVSDEVMALYRNIIATHGKIPTCLEWDHDLPEFDVVCQEVEKIAGL